MGRGCIVLSGMGSWGVGDLAMCLSGDTDLKWKPLGWSFLDLGLDVLVLELDLELAVLELGLEALELGLDLSKSTGVPALVW